MLMDLARNLKLKLKERDLTVAQLSRATKVPQTTIANWLAGIAPKNIDQLKTIADFLETSIDNLCYSKEIIKSETPSLKAVVEDEVLAGVYEVVLRRYRRK